MKERPILFSAPMIRALLAGTKTQTRRIVKPQPDFVANKGEIVASITPDDCRLGRLGKVIPCPYGVPGDRLWVRETWAPHFIYESVKPADILIDGRSCLFYRADDAITGGCTPSQRAKKWRPAIFMPRAASRITLEITDVRVERLQEISNKDAIAEGIAATPWAEFPPIEAYTLLWDAINAGKAPWRDNPWVWAISFRRIK